MQSAHGTRLYAYLIVMAGVALAFVMAVVPHFTAGYRLAGTVLFAGLLPYFVYALMSAMVGGWALYLSGLLVLAVDVAVRVPARFSEFDGTIGPALLITPFVTTFVVLPVGVLIGRVLDRALAPSPRPEERLQGAGEAGLEGSRA